MSMLALAKATLERITKRHDDILSALAGATDKPPRQLRVMQGTLLGLEIAEEIVHEAIRELNQ